MTRLHESTLGKLRELILEMAARAEAILDKAIRAVEQRDPELGSAALEDDLEIDRLDVAVDGAVLQALALQAPLAHELREVVAAKTMATDLERVGDLARNIGQSAVRLAGRPASALPPRLEPLSEATRRILSEAINAYVHGEPQAAREVLASDDRIDRMQDELVRNAIAEIERNPETAAQAVDVILIAESLERVADHATNIAEDVILVTEARNIKHASKLARS